MEECWVLVLQDANSNRIKRRKSHHFEQGIPMVIRFLWTISTLILRNQVKSKKNHYFQKSQMFSYSKQMHILLSKKIGGFVISIKRAYKSKSTFKMLS